MMKCEWWMKSDAVFCAHACIPPKVGICPRFVVTSFGGLSTGQCHERDFTRYVQPLHIVAGPCGWMTFDKYARHDGESTHAAHATSHHPQIEHLSAAPQLSGQESHTRPRRKAGRGRLRQRYTPKFPPTVRSPETKSRG